VIRQAITCDICASEKRQTNHWFVAYEQGGELRISGWNSRHRLRPGSKHLCGQTCLHKLVDDFMARSISVRAQHNNEEIPLEPPAAVDASLTSSSTDDIEFESSARLIPTPELIGPKPAFRPQSGVMTMPQRPYSDDLTRRGDDAARYSSRSRRTEAWEREREREMHTTEDSPRVAARRRTSA
jgi:hypothetical protein